MDLPVLLASGIVSFSATFVLLPWLIDSLRGSAVVGIDINKPDKPRVPEMGGLGVIVGFYAGVGVFTFLAVESVSSPLFYGALTAALGAGFVGMADDMFGLRKRTKAIVPFVLSLPLGAAVYASGDLSLIGINVGLWMVAAVAMGVTSAANAANMLEGMNGLGAGLGIIIGVSMIILSFIEGASQGLFLLFPLVGGLSAFLWFNRYPARVFPGDSMTLFVGATLASAAIISSPPLKTWGAVLFIPLVVEFLLKARGRFSAENYGVVNKEGVLRYDGRIESLLHLVMRGRHLREWQVVGTLWALEASVCAAVILLAFVGL